MLKRFLPWLFIAAMTASEIPLVYLSRSRSSFFSNFETSSIQDDRLIAGVFCLQLAIFAALLISPILKTTKLHRGVFVALIPLFVLLIAAPPLLSKDTGLYLAIGRNAIIFHHNPYQTLLTSEPQNSWVKEIGVWAWVSAHATVYGPLFTIITLPFSALPTLIQATYAYKIFTFIAYLVGLVLLKKLLQKRGMPEGWLYLYLLNPSVLLNGVFDGHNDLLVVPFILWMFLEIEERHLVRGACALAAAVAIKFIPILLLPALWARSGVSRVQTILLSTAITAGAVLLLFAPFGFPFADLKANLESLNTLCLYGCPSFVTWLQQVLPTYAEVVRKALFFFLYGVVALALVKKQTPTHQFSQIEFSVWALLFLYFVYTTLVAPWYFLIIIPLLVILAPSKFYRILLFVLTSYSLLMYFGTTKIL